jgi:uncharacterized DUF497 family protein
MKQKKLLFDWDKGNRTKNLKKHGISIEEQEEVFYDEKGKRIDDSKHSSIVEKRFFWLGKTKIGKKIIVAFTVRDGKIRPISSRKMNRREVSMYEEKTNIS